MCKTLGKIVIILAVILTGVFITVGPSLAVEKNTVGEEMANDGRFIAYHDGTVLDKKTNLLWAAKDNGKNINWRDAKFYCENYNGGGYKDWRMPTREELQGIYNSFIFGNNGHHITKFITLTESFPWSSGVRGSEAAYVDFDHYTASWCWSSLSSKSRSRALPVRYGREAKKVITEAKQEVVAPPPPPPVPEPPPPPPPPPVQEKVTITLNVQFDYNKSVVKDVYYEDIKKVADFMKKYPDKTTVIEGHTDEIGTKEYNKKLSERRADSVRQYLIDKFGVDKSRITAVGYGPNRPIADNETEEGRQKNRRVDAVIETMVTK